LINQATVWVGLALGAQLVGAGPATSGDQIPAGMTEAEYYQVFQSPTGNIFCIFLPDQGRFRAGVRCDLKELTNRPPAPPTCQDLWGDAFSIVDKATVGIRLCHPASDTLIVGNTFILAYGATWKVEVMTCTSATSGVTCVNRGGHGFTISREAQRLF
jgi:hypothetical protein